MQSFLKVKRSHLHTLRDKVNMNCFAFFAFAARIITATLSFSMQENNQVSREVTVIANRKDRIRSSIRFVSFGMLLTLKLGQGHQLI